MKSFIAVVLLFGIMCFSVDEPKAQMEHKNSHERHAVDNGRLNNMKMPEGIAMKTIEADGYKVTFHIMERPAFRKYMDGMGHKSHKMKAGSSHYIVIDIFDPRANKVTQAAVKLKVISPDGNSKESRAFPMMESFGAEFNMANKGQYQVMILFKAQGKKYKGGFMHTIK